MKKRSIKLISLFTLSLLLIIGSLNLVLVTKSYASDKENKNEIYCLAQSKPRSGGFSSGGTKSYSKPKSTIIKPDSGGFSTKPNKTYNNNNLNSSVKPDSGSFSTKPKNNDKTYENKEYKDYKGGSRTTFNRGGFYGFFNPFYGMRHGFKTSSWITKVVVAITIIVVLYIVIDFIRNRKN